MIRFIFFEKDNEHICEVAESGNPCLSSGKFIDPIQDMFKRVMDGTYGSKVIIENIKDRE
jgi:hypothetical protein